MARALTRGLTVRARVRPAPEAPFDRLYDPIVAALVQGDPLARERFATRWSDDAAVAALARAKLGPLPRPLADELLATHRRLGATPESLANIERLARGEAVCAIAGQQPAPLLGPLYSLHKTATAAALAELVTERTGVPCVPAFWMHGEDSDFTEIRGATFATPQLELRDVALPADVHENGGLIGNVPAPALAALDAEALAAWQGLAGHADVAALLAGAEGRARDLGELMSALVLGLFGERGIVVIDPRGPAFRAAARPIIDRYLAAAPALTQAARSAGERLEAATGRRPLADAALESFVFAIDDGVRRKVAATDAQARGAAAPLSPSVALRPVVQDGVLPTVAMACGAAEVAYLAQLREVFERLGVRAAAPVPRLTATWLAPAAVELLDASGAPPWTVVTAADRVVREVAEREVPDALRGGIDTARSDVFQALDRFGRAAADLDASLPQLVESVRGKIDFQLGRLAEVVTSKARHRLERRHPQWSRLRYHLLPGDKLQERRLAGLEPIAYGGRGVADALVPLAVEQARRVAAGDHDHVLIDLAQPR